MGGVAPIAGAGSPKRRDEEQPAARRVGSWLVWWSLLMAFWMWVDDSLLLPEIVAGVIVSIAGATLAEAAQHQSATRIRIRIEWLAPALSLPRQVAQDSVVVFAALWRKLARGEDPPSGYVGRPLAYGEESAEGETRRVLQVAGSSVAPNTFALGIDPDEEVMVVHHLVRPDRGRGGGGGTSSR